MLNLGLVNLDSILDKEEISKKKWNLDFEGLNSLYL